MKTSHGIIGGLLAALLLAIVMMASTNNTLVNLDEEVNKELGNIDTQYQRRADLVPNLVATVKGYASHEEKVFTEVTAARAAVGQTNINVDDVSPEQIETFLAAQDKLSGALSRLLVVAENYPDLKASENFVALQAQLEGTENRISTARTRYNTAVTDYNKQRRAFFTSMIVSMTPLDFPEKHTVFKAQPGADVVPTVNFD